MTLHNGETVEVWADGYGEEGGSFFFEVLADVDGTLPPDSLVLGEAPSDERRKRIAVARFPKDAVSNIASE